MILFLDIDGVLARPQNPLATAHNGLRFDDEAVSTLRYILDTTNAKIVVSSDWRIGKSVAHLRAVFSHYNLDSYIVDKIPDSYEYIGRATEIKDYVEAYGITKYIVVDDIQFQPGEFPYVIQTELRKGLGAYPKDKINALIQHINLT